MKFLIIALLGFTAFLNSALADQIVLNSNQSSYQLRLKGLAYRTEYRQEVRPRTCSREVLDHYERQCRIEHGQQICRKQPDRTECGLTPTGEQCHIVPGATVCNNELDRQICNDIARYRTEFYNCDEIVSVPYQVYDHDVENDITVNVDKSKYNPQLNEILSFVQNGDDLSIQAVQTTGRAIIFIKKSVQDLGQSGIIKRTKTNIQLTILDKNIVFSAFLTNPTELSVSANGLSISTGLIIDPSLVKVSLFVERHRALAKNILMIDRELNPGEYVLTNSAANTLVRISFSQLGFQSQIAGNKINATLLIQSRINIESVLNRKDLPTNLPIEKSVRKIKL